MGRNGVRKASETSIEIDFYYRGERCREKIKLKPTAANLKRAEWHRAAILEAIDNGTFDYAVTFPESQKAQKFTLNPGASVTISDYLSNWLKDKKKTVKASTYEGYEKIVNNQLIPEFGDYHLTEIGRAQVKQWIKSLTCTPKRIRNIISPLRDALNHAVDDELIQSNPLEGWKIQLKKAKKKSKIDPFSEKERNDILNNLEGQNKNLVQFAFWTGLRTSELIALDWDDIDWHRNSVFITKALTQAADEPEEPKTLAGEREVDLLPPALEALKRQKSHTYLKGVEIFQNPRTGERWQGDKPIRESMWRPALKRAKVRYRKPYSTRHTFASMALMAGEDIRAIAQVLGHEDWAFTARTYARFIPKDAPKLGQKLCPDGHEMVTVSSEKPAQ